MARLWRSLEPPPGTWRRHQQARLEERTAWAVGGGETRTTRAAYAEGRHERDAVLQLLAGKCNPERSVPDATVTRLWQHHVITRKIRTSDGHYMTR